jgi:hypothetical protein
MSSVFSKVINMITGGVYGQTKTETNTETNTDVKTETNVKTETLKEIVIVNNDDEDKTGEFLVSLENLNIPMQTILCNLSELVILNVDSEYTASGKISNEKVLNMALMMLSLNEEKRKEIALHLENTINDDQRVTVVEFSRITENKNTLNGNVLSFKRNKKTNDEYLSFSSICIFQKDKLKNKREKIFELFKNKENEDDEKVMNMRRSLIS